MTTIAFKNGTMACDSRVNATWIDSLPMNKVHKIGGKLIGVCGDLTWIQGFLRWIKDNEWPYPEGNGSALVYNKETGCLRMYEGDSDQSFLVGQPHAIGSGSSFAMGAMLAGKSARAAVAIAIELDSSSGHPVQYKGVRIK